MSLFNLNNIFYKAAKSFGIFGEIAVIMTLYIFVAAVFVGIGALSYYFGNILVPVLFMIFTAFVLICLSITAVTLWKLWKEGF